MNDADSDAINTPWKRYFHDWRSTVMVAILQKTWEMNQYLLGTINFDVARQFSRDYVGLC